MRSFRVDDLIISVAYFSIPLQIVIAYLRYPRLRSMPWSIVGLVILFALFIFLCGAGHLLRCLEMTSGRMFDLMNFATAVISLITALYLLPLVPHLFESLDKTLIAEIESNRKLMTFMSFLCHEIRNPLFAITSSITFMEDDKSLSPDQRGSVECIAQSANLMLRLVDDVLDISKLESGKLLLEQRQFDLVQMFEGVGSTMKNEIALKHDGKVEFQMCLMDRVPRHVVGDSVRLLQMAYNLLSNSAKFTESGFVKLAVDLVPLKEALQNDWVETSISDEYNNENKNKPRDNDSTAAVSLEDDDDTLGLLKAEEGEGNMRETSTSTPIVLKLEVTDSGVGISSEQQKHIFKPYSQAKISDYRKHGGTGLGLSIVAKLIEIVGGSIHLKSILNEGSTFTLYIPLRIASTSSGNRWEGSSSALGSFSHNSSTLQEGKLLVGTKESVDELVTPKLQMSSTTKRIMDVSTPNEGSSSLLISQPTPTCRQLVGGTTKRTQTRTSSDKFNCDEGIILIVDDNAINRKILGKMLAKFELNFTNAVDGQEAVNYVKESRNVTHNPSDPYVQLILMDWSMPVMDGCEATRAIRDMGLTDVPIVALTACALEQGLQELLDAGANEIATKPILRNDLLEICYRYLPTIPKN